jgi:hypothetical protein
MSDSKTPTAASTRPLGNSEPQPTPLARDIAPNVRTKLKEFPDANARMRGLTE